MTSSDPYGFELAEPPVTAGAGRPFDPRAMAATDFALAHPDQWFIYDRGLATELGVNAATKLSNRASSLRNLAKRRSMALQTRSAVEAGEVRLYVRAVTKPAKRADSPTEALDAAPEAPAGETQA